MNELVRSLSDIAKDILADWVTINPYALEYVKAMSQLKSITDKYYADDAKSIVLYFLSNASAWRGPVAKQIKAELKTLVQLIETRG
jgi:hypothetical protein